MHHVFVYALPASNDKGARIAEISAVCANNFGPYKKANMGEAYSGKAGTDPKGLLTELRERVIPPNPFVVVSHGIEVTRALLRNEYEQTGLEDIFAGRAWVDTNQLAWPLVASGDLKSRSLDALCNHFGVKLESPNDSASMCTAIVQIYGYMMRRYRTALAGEGFIRDAGGETLENLRKIVGF